MAEETFKTIQVLALVTSQKFGVRHVGEDTTYFGHRTWRNWDGTDLETPRRGLALLVSEVLCKLPWGKSIKIIHSWKPMSHFSGQPGKTAPGVQY